MPNSTPSNKVNQEIKIDGFQNHFPLKFKKFLKLSSKPEKPKSTIESKKE